MSRDLCTLTDVYTLTPGYVEGDDTATDTTVAALITEQSRDAMERTGREFTAITGLNPRSFDIDTNILRTRRIQIGDMASLNSVTIKDAQGNTVETVDLAGVVTEPRIREDWQPISTLWFRSDAATPASLFLTYVAEISATWGFPSVPTTVKQAVARLTLVRYLNDVAAAGTQLAEAANRVDFNISASLRWSLDALDRFYVPLFQSTGDWSLTSGSPLSRGVAGVDW